MRCILVVLVMLATGWGEIESAIHVPRPDPVMEAWRWQVFSERDGLASIRVRAIASSEAGVWFATDQGVSRYDGMAWQTYRVEDGLLSDDVRAVQIGQDGIAWFGTSLGVCRFDPQARDLASAGISKSPWVVYDTSSGLPSEEIEDLKFDRQGVLWAATQAGVAYFNTEMGRWLSFTTDDGLADNQVNGLAIDQSGAIWFATERGASRYDGAGWQSYRRGEGLPGTSVTSIFASRDGAIWFAQYGTGLVCLKGGNWTRFNQTDGLPDDDVRQVFQTNDGIVWVVCRSGIARLDQEGTWQAYLRHDLPGLGEPYTAGVDAQGAIWIGGPSSRGVIRFDYAGKRIKVFELGKVLDMTRGRGIGQDKDGAIWFGSGNGAVRYDGSSWFLNQGFEGGEVRTVFADEDGALYLGGRDERGPLVIEIRGLARNVFRYGLQGDIVTSLGRTRDGTLWAGLAGGGLYRCESGSDTWQIQQERREIPRRVSAITTSLDGALWLAGRGRDLCRRSVGGMWRAFNVNKTGDIQTLTGTQDGSLWLGFGRAGGGAVQLDAQGQITTFTVKDGLAHDEVHALVEDPHGNLWAATSNGVAKFDGDNKRWVTLRGMPDMNVRDLSVARDGAIWMRTVDGNVVRYWNDGELPEAHLENPPRTVAADGSVNFEWRGRDRWYASDTELEYAFRLDGGAWTDFTDHIRASFSSLDDGPHTFEVRARDVDLNIQMSPVVHSFVVETPIWKQPWFLSMLLVMLGTIVWQARRILIRDKELAEANARLKELDQLKTDFFSNVSHELRTPMTAIKGYVDNMLDGIAGDVTERQERYLNRVKSNADRLTRLINDLLDLSRIDRGRTDLLQLNIGPVEMHEVVHEAVVGLRPLADEAGLKLVFKGEDCKGLADRDRVVQMVTNLTGNAIKFTEPGGEIQVTVRSDGTGFVQTIVRDTGKGIPQEDLARIFDRFHQVKGTMGGTGLGLPITKELAELHGGKIWAESEVGKGSAFTFSIPEAR